MKTTKVDLTDVVLYKQPYMVQIDTDYYRWHIGYFYPTPEGVILYKDGRHPCHVIQERIKQVFRIDEFPDGTLPGQKFYLSPRQRKNLEKRNGQEASN